MALLRLSRCTVPTTPFFHAMSVATGLSSATSKLLLIIVSSKSTCWKDALKSTHTTSQRGLRGLSGLVALGKAGGLKKILSSSSLRAYPCFPN